MNGALVGENVIFRKRRREYSFPTNITIFPDNSELSNKKNILKYDQQKGGGR
jgi:hypothetical protein